MAMRSAAFESVDSRVRLNLSFIDTWGHLYLTEHKDVEFVAVRDLKSWRRNLPVKPIAGENYDNLLVFRNQHELRVQLPAGRVVEFHREP